MFEHDPDCQYFTFPGTAGISISVDGITYTTDNDIEAEALIGDMCPPCDAACYAHGDDGSYVELWWEIPCDDDSGFPDFDSFDPLTSPCKVLLSEEGV